MADFLRGKLPDDPRTLLELLSKEYPDPKKRRCIFEAAVHDDPKYMQAVIELAFTHWSNGKGGAP